MRLSKQKSPSRYIITGMIRILKQKYINLVETSKCLKSINKSALAVTLTRLFMTLSKSKRRVLNIEGDKTKELISGIVYNCF